MNTPPSARNPLVGAREKEARPARPSIGYAAVGLVAALCLLAPLVPLLWSDFAVSAVAIADPVALGEQGPPRLLVHVAGTATLGSGPLHGAELGGATCRVSLAADGGAELGSAALDAPIALTGSGPLELAVSLRDAGLVKHWATASADSLQLDCRAELVVRYLHLLPLRLWPHFSRSVGAAQLREWHDLASAASREDAAASEGRWDARVTAGVLHVVSPTYPLRRNASSASAAAMVKQLRLSADLRGTTEVELRLRRPPLAKLIERAVPSLRSLTVDASLVAQAARMHASYRGTAGLKQGAWDLAVRSAHGAIELLDDEPAPLVLSSRSVAVDRALLALPAPAAADAAAVEEALVEGDAGRRLLSVVRRRLASIASCKGSRCDVDESMSLYMRAHTHEPPRYGYHRSDTCDMSTDTFLGTAETVK